MKTTGQLRIDYGDVARHEEIKPKKKGHRSRPVVGDYRMKGIDGKGVAGEPPHSIQYGNWGHTPVAHSGTRLFLIAQVGSVALNKTRRQPMKSDPVSRLRGSYRTLQCSTRLDRVLPSFTGFY